MLTEVERRSAGFQRMVVLRWWSVLLVVIGCIQGVHSFRSTTTTGNRIFVGATANHKAKPTANSATRKQKSWDETFADLVAYKEEHGTANIPYQCKEYPALAIWVIHVRHRERKLSKEKRAKLEEIGFTMDGVLQEKNDQKWEAAFQRLNEYKEVEGHCAVPQRWDEHGQKQKLGLWVKTQRQLFREGKLEVDRIQRLDSVGFVWSVKNGKKGSTEEQEQLWQQRCQELIEFQEQNGHCRVTKRYPENVPLGLWVYTQRRSYKSGLLRADRKKLLEEIGFAWNFDNIRDHDWHEKLKEFVRHGEDWNSGPMSNGLTAWIRNQRDREAKGLLERERVAMLDKIGFDWLDAK